MTYLAISYLAISLTAIYLIGCTIIYKGLNKELQGRKNNGTLPPTKLSKRKYIPFLINQVVLWPLWLIIHIVTFGRY